MTLPILAAIDIGSNTIRLLVASPMRNGFKRHLIQQKVTRLGEGLEPGEPLSPGAVTNTIEVLRDFQKKALASGAHVILAGATSAVREAKGGQDFMSRVSDELGLETLILTGKQEADLAAAGVISALPSVSNEALIFDLGGRSTEFIATEDGHVLTSISLSLGAVALTESFLTLDPPALRQLKALQDEVAKVLDQGLTQMLKKVKPKILIGTAGTVTTLVAMVKKLTVYQPGLVHNRCLTRQDLEDLFKRLSALKAAERASIPGLPEDRADIIVAGTGVVLEIMKYIKTDQLTVSDAGLLEGLWLVAAGQRRIA
ncbi:MAG: Ppx/GppA family phosphatase [Deltaproteobacteria bacterium]|nr:Ppx/GppA family phosphatase [Deltaproteobacteria bacterium]MBW2050772.1 Ppx/GppA family phosphatase [Deltaproteobacteria bacterium]MBW2141362.1 Ppx/GppA family phosphatase [Deltaproteobacteria bacterium]MBW2321968.1 Ppx/GppA family phosphatase [Deltaproteobacteria bacterium]